MDAWPIRSWLKNEQFLFFSDKIFPFFKTEIGPVSQVQVAIHHDELLYMKKIFHISSLQCQELVFIYLFSTPKAILVGDHVKGELILK